MALLTHFWERNGGMFGCYGSLLGAEYVEGSVVLLTQRWKRNGGMCGSYASLFGEEFSYVWLIWLTAGRGKEIVSGKEISMAHN